MESKNYQEKKEMDRLEHDIREATAVSHKYYQELQKLADINGQRDAENRSNKARIEHMETEVAQNQNRIAHLNEVRE